MPVTARYQNSWTERNIDAVAHCFDHAFANVLEAEFKRITTDMSPPDIVSYVNRSRVSIDLLKNSGNSPDYQNPMVALQYVLRYQLSHINLAYSLIKSTQTENEAANMDDLQVVDLGAGSLSMAFGLVLAVADALESGVQVKQIRMDCIDTSTTMMDLGVELANAFYARAKREDLEPLVQAFNRVKVERYTDWRSVNRLDDYHGYSKYWLSALHTFYDESEADIYTALSDMSSGSEPIEVFITCHSGKADIVERVWPRNVTPYYKCIDPILKFTGDIEHSHVGKVAIDNGLWQSHWGPRIFGGFKTGDLVAFTTSRMSNIDEQDIPITRLEQLALLDADLAIKIKELQQHRNKVRADIRDAIGDDPCEYIIEGTETNMTTTIKLTQHERTSVNRNLLESLAVERFGDAGNELIRDSIDTKQLTRLQIKVEN
ncbi:MAG: hypothetical protein F4X57_07385 [Chloroflexi bacterium]|nr:hypothetical protein [Chloroflexota bacterium]